MSSGMDLGLEYDVFLSHNKDKPAVRTLAGLAGNLSELELTLGQVAEAAADAEQSVTFAERSEDAFERMSKRTTFADAQHQAGDPKRARALFEQAENMQSENQPQYPLLYSLGGFRYCDLLLAPAERLAWRQHLLPKSQSQAPKSLLSSVSDRAEKTLKWAIQVKTSILSIALDHPTLARVKLYHAILSGTGRVPDCEASAREAVKYLRAAGQEDGLPRGLLTQAWIHYLAGDTDACRADLDEAREIAERGTMRLHSADIHLSRTRLFGRLKDESAYPWGSPQEDLAKARRLIEECGYGRRLQELEDAEAALLDLLLSVTV